MTQFTDSIKEIAKNYKPYEQWEQNQADLEAKKKYLNQKIPFDKFEHDKLQKKAENIVRVSEIMDTRSEDNAQDVEMLTQTASGIALTGVAVGSNIILSKYASTSKNLIKRNILLQIGSLGAILLATIGTILWGNAKTKEASRLGRFQAKIHDLKDPKNFVQYTDEQMAEAQKIADKMPPEKKGNSLLKAIRNIKEMRNDKTAYEKWKANNKQTVSGISGQQLSKEQIKQAKADKDLILTIIKKVNNTAEDYTENTENAFDTLQATSFLATIPLGFGLNKLFNTLKLNMPKKAVSAGIALLFPIAIASWSLFAEKKASRVGRYQARKEILKNPEILRSFSDEELKQAENIKAPKQQKGFFEKIADNFIFLKKYFKDSKEYDNYLKNEAAKRNNLNKALLQTNVSKEQLEEAKHLQEKTFMSFDKMDEMSQRYSEDMEAAGEISKNTINTLFSLLGLGFTLGIPMLFVFGKFPTHKVIKLLSNLGLKKGSVLRNNIDEIYKIINNDKTLKSAFNKFLSPLSDNASKETLLNNPKLASVIQKDLLSIMSLDNPAQIQNIVKDSLKDGKIATWVQQLTYEIITFVGRLKGKIPENKTSNFYNNYKHIVQASILAFVPVLSVIVGIPFAINSWFTNIQKKAGKIGIMKAIKELDNDNLYADKNTQNLVSSNKDSLTDLKNQQLALLNKYFKKS